MTTPAERLHDATRRLLDLLEHGESLSVEAITLRAELAEATAAAGHLEDAHYQAGELLRDARREYGPEDPASRLAERTLAGIEALALDPHQGKPDASS